MTPNTPQDTERETRTLPPLTDEEKRPPNVISAEMCRKCEVLYRDQVMTPCERKWMDTIIWLQREIDRLTAGTAPAPVTVQDVRGEEFNWHEPAAQVKP